MYTVVYTYLVMISAVLTIKLQFRAGPDLMATNLSNWSEVIETSILIYLFLCCDGQLTTVSIFHYLSILHRPLLCPFRPFRVDNFLALLQQFVCCFWFINHVL